MSLLMPFYVFEIAGVCQMVVRHKGNYSVRELLQIVPRRHTPLLILWYPYYVEQLHGVEGSGLSCLSSRMDPSQSPQLLDLTDPG